MNIHTIIDTFRPFHRHQIKTPGLNEGIGPILMPGRRPTEMDPTPMPTVHFPALEEMLEQGKHITEIHPTAPAEYELPNQKPQTLFILA